MPIAVDIQIAKLSLKVSANRSEKSLRFFYFPREQDENGQFFTTEECPHPCNYKKMGTAKSEYEYRLRGDVEYIPAKKGNIR